MHYYFSCGRRKVPDTRSSLIRGPLPNSSSGKHTRSISCFTASSMKTHTQVHWRYWGRGLCPQGSTSALNILLSILTHIPTSFTLFNLTVRPNPKPSFFLKPFLGYSENHPSISNCWYHSFDNYLFKLYHNLSCSEITGYIKCIFLFFEVKGCVFF